MCACPPAAGPRRSRGPLRGGCPPPPSPRLGWALRPPRGLGRATSGFLILESKRRRSPAAASDPWGAGALTRRCASAGIGPSERRQRGPSQVRRRCPLSREGRSTGREGRTATRDPEARPGTPEAPAVACERTARTSPGPGRGAPIPAPPRARAPFRRPSPPSWVPHPPPRPPARVCCGAPRLQLCPPLASRSRRESLRSRVLELSVPPDGVGAAQNPLPSACVITRRNPVVRGGCSHP